MRKEQFTGINSGRTFILRRKLKHTETRAVQQATEGGQLFALKHPRSADDTGSAVALIREANIQQRFSGHPGVTPIVLFDRTEAGIPFLVTPFAKDGTLATYLKRRGRNPSPDIAVSLTMQIGATLAELNEANVRHRDVKPENILITRRAEGITAQLTDFGNAIDLNNIPASIRFLSDAGDQSGFVNEIVYPLFTGKPAYDPGKTRLPRTFRELIGRRKMTPLHEAVEGAVTRVLHGAPYPSMSELLDALNRNIAQA